MPVSTGISGVGAVEAGENCGSDFARLVAAQREANDLVLASSEIAFSPEVVVARGDMEGLMLAASAAGAKDDFISAVAGAAP